MLQTLNLQLITTIDTEIRLDSASAALQAMPGEGLESLPNFASLLEPDAAVLQGHPATVTAGEPLPQPGNLLPQAELIKAEQPAPLQPTDHDGQAAEALPATPLVEISNPPKLPVLAIMLTPQSSQISQNLPDSPDAAQFSGGDRQPNGIRELENRLPGSAQPRDSGPSLMPPALKESHLAGSWQASYRSAAEVQPRMLQQATEHVESPADPRQLTNLVSREESETGSRRDTRAFADTDRPPGLDKTAAPLPSTPERPFVTSNWQQATDEFAALSRTQSDPAIMMPTRQAPASPGGVMAPPTTSTLVLDLRLDHPDWGQQLGERVLFMAGNKLQSAEIRLSPAEMGPVRVQVNVDDGKTTVTFHAQNALTREVLEQSLPRLRELFAETGLSLGEASVNEQGVNREHGDGGFRDEQIVVDAADIDDPDSDSREPAPGSLGLGSVSTSLVDTFV